MTTATRGRTVEVVRAAIGAWHLTRAARSGTPHRTLDGVLGLRQVVQAAVVLRRGTADAHTASAAVDALHGTSMVPLALLPRFRGFALGQAAVALVLVVAEAAVVGSGRR